MKRLPLPLSMTQRTFGYRTDDRNWVGGLQTAFPLTRCCHSRPAAGVGEMHSLLGCLQLNKAIPMAQFVAKGDGGRCATEAEGEEGVGVPFL